MKMKILTILEEYLLKQRYPYLWEITLYSMLKKDDQLKFVTFIRKAIGQPRAAICLPEHADRLKKDPEEIINFIKRIKVDDNQVCVVVAHADYNPANLQALYVLDCINGEEKECFDSVFKHWKDCSELFFFAMDVDSVMAEIIARNKKPEKKSSGGLFPSFWK